MGLLSSCLAIAAIALVAPGPAVAAALFINDALLSENIIFSLNYYEGGFVLDGTLVQEGTNNPVTVTVPEVTAAGGPITHTFPADRITGGLVPTSGVIAFAEAGVDPTQGVSEHQRQRNIGYRSRTRTRYARTGGLGLAGLGFSRRRNSN